MAAAGAKVLVNDLGTSVKGEGKDAGPAQKVVDEIRSAGGAAAASTDSVADWESANRIVQTALDAFLDQYGYPDFGSPLLDSHTPNEWVVERYKNVSLEDLVAQEVQAFSAVVSMLEKLPEKTITEHNLFDRVANNTYHHYREHLRDIRHWLRTQAVNS